MAVVTAFTAARMKEIEDSCIVNGAVDLSGDLTLERFDGSTFLAGNIMGPRGLQGIQGKTGPAGADADYEPIALGANVNLNTLEEPRHYYQSLTVQASTALNYPYPVAGWLEVMASSSRQQVLQRYTDYITSRVWIRNRYVGTWTPWKLMYKAPTSGYTVNPVSGWAVTVYSFLTINQFAWIDFGVERTGANIPNTTSGNITNEVMGVIANQDLWPAPSVGPSLSITTTGYVIGGYIDSTGQLVLSALGPSASDVPNINTGNNFRMVGMWPLREVVPT